MFNFQDRYNRQIAFWLFVCAAVILAMILLGGVTRLTHSGLSMVEWKPLVGVIPPLSDADWQQTFSKYQQFPEYQKINHGMDIESFKSIFMYEYFHRLLGRFIGILFLLPLLFFYFSKRIPKGLGHKLVTIFLLGGLQGLLGWYMVKSGLVDDPHVSQYRLTAHLGAAVAIYGYILWVAFGLMGKQEQRWYPTSLRNFSYLLTSLVFLMILSGGLVAGTRAGLAYPTFPLMGESFFPPGLYRMLPAWQSALEDITTIQFNHRMLAYLIFALGLGFVIKISRNSVNGQLRIASYFLLATLFIQVILGISTLLQHVPVSLAASHQVGAILLLTAALFISHNLRGHRPFTIVEPSA